jgi:hypothetical protein
MRPARRTYRTWTIDSCRWDAWRPRQTDIMITAYAKSGTTWMQQIVALLVFDDIAPKPLMDISVWLDRRFGAELGAALARLDAQTHRRFLKTHLPADGLPLHDPVSYIHISRDGRDAALSFHNHALGFPDCIGIEDPEIGRIASNSAAATRSGRRPSGTIIPRKDATRRISPARSRRQGGVTSWTPGGKTGTVATGSPMQEKGCASRPRLGRSGTSLPPSTRLRAPIAGAGHGVAGASIRSTPRNAACARSSHQRRTLCARAIQAAGRSAPATNRWRVSGSKSAGRARRRSRWKADPSELVMR